MPTEALTKREESARRHARLKLLLEAQDALTKVRDLRKNEFREDATWKAFDDIGRAIDELARLDGHLIVHVVTAPPRTTKRKIRLARDAKSES